jgi:hypothetical protein
VPPELLDAMIKHLKLHHESEMSSDEMVLPLYPMPIKRRVLR